MLEWGSLSPVEPGEGAWSKDPCYSMRCPGCGRFCRGYTYTGYNGWFDILYQHTNCSKCGEGDDALT